MLDLRRGRSLAGVALAGSALLVLVGARPVVAERPTAPTADTLRFVPGPTDRPEVILATDAAPVTAPMSEAELAAVSLLDRLDGDGARGQSGRLRATVLPPRLLTDVLGVDDVALLGLDEPGVHTLTDPRDGSARTVMTLVPFKARDARGRIGAYKIGSWIGEKNPAHASALPAGFIKVTAENADTRVSEHFTLRDFLTKDQAAVWPKYLVLRMEVVDKLELMIDELRLMGHDVRHVKVMSGFRTPQYNAQGLGAGRATESRHQYGDAADIFVDNGRAGRQDDLTGDGRADIRDARVIAEAANRVEKKHPSLVGGVGVYPATSAHPPFVHVDVRGHRARWGSL